jgi:hypothetical protein
MYVYNYDFQIYYVYVCGDRKCLSYMVKPKNYTYMEYLAGSIIE